MPFIALRPCRIDGVDYQENEVVPDHVNSRQTVAFGVVSPIPEAAAAGIRAGTASAVEAFDPGEHTVAEVLAYLDANPDQLERVTDAELSGKARKTLLDALDERRPAEPDGE